MESTAQDSMQVLATVFFGLAVLHTFVVDRFNAIARRFRHGSIGENIFHYLGEVEIVFGVWAAILITVWSLRFGQKSAVTYLESVNFTEAGFVFVIMCMAATKPILDLARWGIDAVARLIPISRTLSLYAVTLIVGPLLGSLITEPAAMTVTALLLKTHFFDQNISRRCKYATLGLLFVNVSIGGTLTHFAAPPVLMVAKAWGWDSAFMVAQFGYHAIIAVIISTIITTFVFRKQLNDVSPATAAPRPIIWMSISHVIFMALTIYNGHHMTFFFPLFLFFLGWCAVTKEHQDDLKIRESLLVAFFLGGLVTLGQLQGWWLQPVVAQLSDLSLYFGAAGLTAFTDNAALTYLGTLVPNMTDTAKYALVSGAVVGGGLTIIANAPNPAGYGILLPSFGDEGISPLYLFLGALPYTVIAAIVFLL